MKIYHVKYSLRMLLNCHIIWTINIYRKMAPFTNSGVSLITLSSTVFKKLPWKKTSRVPIYASLTCK